jgi:single-strand DNA-binding protein
MIVRGRIQTGSYTNRDGQRVYTTEVIIEDQEFAESRNSSSQGESSFSQSFRQNEERPRESQSINQAPADAGDGFMNIPDGVSDEGLPFS